jgi:hypothetical protein
MTKMAIHFVDPTIPGLSGRDMHADLVGLGGAGRTERLVSRGLRHLSVRLLRDLGLDRASA